MPFKFIVFGLLIGFILSISIGPVTMLIFQRTMHKGRIFGIVSGMGVALADTIYATISRTGTVLLEDFIIKHQFRFQVGLGILLIVFGIIIFFSSNSREKHFNVDKNYFKNFLTAFLLTIANVLYIFTYGFVFAKFIPFGSYNIIDEVALILGVFFGTNTRWIFITYVFSHFSIKIEKLYILNKILGSVIFMFGIASFVELFLL